MSSRLTMRVCLRLPKRRCGELVAELDYNGTIRGFDGDPTRITRLCGQLRGMVFMDSVVAVEGLAEEVVDGEKRVLFRTLNEQGQPAVSNGIVCGRPGI